VDIGSFHDASSGDMDRKCDLLKAEIGRLSQADAVSFWDLFNEVDKRAYSHELWGAAYVINAGCGDDTFDDFRSSLISRGQHAFDGAVSDPESLAEDASDLSTWFYEGIQNVVREAVQAKLGRPLGRTGLHQSEPSGSKWSEADLPGLYPRLTARFG
jgi:hypothetical protein